MRRSLVRRTRIAPLAKYVASRRALATELHGFTPSRFLHRLGMLAPAAAWEPPAIVRPPQRDAPFALAESEPVLSAPVPADVLWPPEPAVAPGPEAAAHLAVVMPPSATAPATAPVSAMAPVPATTLPAAATAAIAPPVRARPVVPPAAVLPPAAPARSVSRRVAPHAPPRPVMPGTPLAAPPIVATPSSIDLATGAGEPASIEVAPDAPSPVEPLESPSETTEPAPLVVEAPAPIDVRAEAGQPGAREIESAAPMTAAVPAHVESALAAETVDSIAPVHEFAAPPRVEPATVPGDVSKPVERVRAAARVEDGAAPAAPAAQAVESAHAEPANDVDSRLPDPPVVPEPAPAPPLRRRARVQEMPLDYARTKSHAERRPAQPLPEAARAPRTPQRPYGAPPSGDARALTPSPDADLAFGPSDGSDRSPLAWAARLADSLRDPSAAKPVIAPPALVTSEPAPTPAPTPAPPPRTATRVASPTGMSVPAPPPAAAARAAEPVVSAPVVAVPVSPQARSFLQPLVGIDPADATFIQGPAADAITDARRADAVAIGSVVALGREFAGDTSPEGLGLLAHELTHVARRAAPRFVPPIARARSPRQLPPMHAGVAAVREAAPAAPASGSEAADEEATALRVEGRVRAAAAAQTQGAPSPVAQRVPAAEAVPEAIVERDQPATTAAPASPKWGGLPAPWEPMPFDSAQGTSFDVAQDASFESAQGNPLDVAFDGAREPVSVPVPASAPVQAPVAVPAAFDGSTHAAAIHAADDDRAPEEATAGAAPNAGAEKSEPKPPDLDRLARQVYSVLKRRLQADAAREWA